MLILKNLGVPLVPFAFEAIMRWWLIVPKQWWELFDAGTLVLTFCIWLLFLLSSSPKSPPIPTDTTTRDKYEAVRNIFIVYVMTGFMTFGVIAVTRILMERIPDQKYQVLSEIASLSYMFAVLLSLVILGTVYLKSKEIKELLS